MTSALAGCWSCGTFCILSEAGRGGRRERLHALGNVLRTAREARHLVATQELVGASPAELGGDDRSAVAAVATDLATLAAFLAGCEAASLIGDVDRAAVCASQADAVVFPLAEDHGVGAVAVHDMAIRR